MENPMQVCDVVYRYEDESCAIDHVNIQIKPGEFVAILGHNGSGKSTLAKLMNALYIPTEGKIIACGMDTQFDVEPWQIRSHVGMVFQNPDNQIVATIVRDDVAFGLENIGVPRDEMITRIDQALHAVQMQDYADKAPHTLSGGQKQRVAVAGVIAMQPEVMVMDESTSMLDPSGRKAVFDTVRRLNRELGISVVWITHFMEEAAQAQRVIVLNEGKLAMEGTPEAVFSQVDKLTSMGLDIPPMTRLAYELRKEGLPLPDNIFTVDDMVKELDKVLCPSNLSM